MFIALILTVVFIAALARLFASIFWMGPRRSYGYNHPSGFGRYHRCSRHHHFGREVLFLLALVALQRLFTRRF